jgi:glycosyltransferase involved in cell wall biosynthesis
MKLRVAHLITQLELGGAQRNTLYTVGHLNPESYEPILISGPGGILDEETQEAPWPTHFVKWLVRPVNPFKDVLALVTLYQFLRKTKPHIVHTHSSKAGILGRLAAYVAGVPVIIHTFHGFGFTPEQPRWLFRLFVWLERVCAHWSTHLIFVSKDNMEEARSLGIGTTKPQSLIRSGIAIQEPSLLSPVREEWHIPASAWVVVSVGNFKPQKNPMGLAQIADAVHQKDPSVHFLLVGDGTLRVSVEAYVKSKEITEQVHFLGWRKDIPAILSASNCFLLTSLWEGLPRGLVEAAVARLPAVAFAVNGVKDILIEGETGFPVPPHDTSLASEKILWLKNHPFDARRMGSLAGERVRKEFDIDTMVRQQENLYKSLYDAVPLKNYYEPLWAERSN